MSLLTPVSPYKSDVRVKMLQTEVSVLQQKMSTMEQDHRQAIQRLQRTLEVSWRKKDLTMARESMQKQEPVNHGAPVVSNVSHDARSTSRACDGTTTTDDRVWNVQIESIRRQLQSLESKLDEKVTQLVTTHASKERRVPPPEDPFSLERLQERIDAAVQIALKKKLGMASQPAASDSTAVPLEVKGAMARLDVLSSDMAQQSQVLSLLKQDLDCQRQEQMAFMAEVENRLFVELATINEHLLRHQSTFREASCRWSNATEEQRSQTANEVQHSVLDLERNLDLQMDLKLSIVQDGFRDAMESAANEQQAAQVERARNDDEKVSVLESLQQELAEMRQSQDLVARMVESMQQDNMVRATISQTAVSKQIEWEQQMNDFWAKAARLEEHLSEQFSNQEQQLRDVRVCTSSNAEPLNPAVKMSLNDGMDQRIQSWDEQLADLIQFVEETVKDQSEVANDAVCSVQALEEQHKAMQQKLDAVSDTWDKKLKQLTDWIQRPVAEEHQAHDDLRTQIRRDFSQELSQWGRAVDAVNATVHDRMAALGMLQLAQETVGASLEKSQVQFKDEMASLVAQGRAHVDQIMSINTALSLGQEEQNRIEQERQARIHAWQTQMDDLVRLADHQTTAMSAARQREERAIEDSKKANEALEVLQRDHSDVLTQLETAKLQCVQYEKERQRLRGENRIASQQRSATLEKRKGQLRTLLLADDEGYECSDGVELVYQSPLKGAVNSTGTGLSVATASGDQSSEWSDADDSKYDESEARDDNK